MLKVSIIGAHGKMGAAIISEVLANYKASIEIVSGVNAVHRESGAGFPIYAANELEAAVKNAQITINFTNAEAEVANIEKIASAKKDMIIGTTGFTPEQRKRIEEAIAKNRVSAVIASNFSPLVNTHIYLVKKAAQILAPLGYDFGIVEEHHTAKKDSPSGTAKSLAQAIISSKGPSNIIYRKEELKPKEKSDLDMGVLRLGGTIGLHDVRIVGQHGRLVLTSHMYSRTEFAKGAIEAALWLQKNRKAGKIFGMEEILGLA